MSVQIIELNGAPALAVVPIEEWRAIQTRLEDLEDIADAEAARHEETFPAEFVDRLLEGESPLRVWRQHRGLSLRNLAERSGASEQDLEKIEKEKSVPDTDLCQRLALLLECDPEDLSARAEARADQASEQIE
jgi:DNA-binding XRE family transcriptional regulator